MASSVVIKVKHGETLRRFNACIDEYGKLDLDIDRLRKKIQGLFKFGPDAHFSLTYTDEDGDVIALVDEEDLHDIMKQSLNPLRITVKLNGSIHQKMSIGTPQHLIPNSNANASIHDTMKSIPESFFEALSKLPLDLASKAVYSAIAELVDGFTKTRGTASTTHRDTTESEASKNNRSTLKEMHGYTFKDVIDASGSVPRVPMIKESRDPKNDRNTLEAVLKCCVADHNANHVNSNSYVQNSTEGVKMHKECDFTDRCHGIDVDPPRLNSQFIEYSSSDLHDTVLAPSTQFTKMWRILNNGLDAWPQGTRLVWIEGGQFSNKLYVELEIPMNGLPVGNELEVAASFVAPQLPGNHVSYWSLASPSGQRFGQHVGVFIQVKPPQKDSSLNNSEGIDLNFPPESNESCEELAHLTLGPMDVGEQTVDANPNEKLRIPVMVSLEALRRSQRMAQKYNRIMVDTALRTQSPNLSSKAENGNSDVEQTLLSELDSMGFKQFNLNKEILRLNNFDLKQSVEDLCWQ